MIVHFYGRLADLCETNSIELETAETIFQLKEQVELMFPVLKGQKYLIANNKRISSENENISFNSEIALMPPYSGG